MYTIHGSFWEADFSTCILSFATYEAMLQILKDLQPGLNPASLMTDSEKGAIRAFLEEFPHQTVQAAFFILVRVFDGEYKPQVCSAITKPILISLHGCVAFQL